MQDHPPENIAKRVCDTSSCQIQFDSTRSSFSVVVPGCSCSWLCQYISGFRRPLRAGAFSSGQRKKPFASKCACECALVKPQAWRAGNTKGMVSERRLEFRKLQSVYIDGSATRRQTETRGSHTAKSHLLAILFFVPSFPCSSFQNFMVHSAKCLSQEASLSIHRLLQVPKVTKAQFKRKHMEELLMSSKITVMHKIQNLVETFFVHYLFLLKFI